MLALLFRDLKSKEVEKVDKYPISICSRLATPFERNQQLCLPDCGIDHHHHLEC
jgi:hypothetical protein